MKKKLLLALVTAIFLLSIALVGCQTAGITQAQYDQLAAQLKDAQAKYTEAQNNINKLQNIRHRLRCPTP